MNPSHNYVTCVTDLTRVSYALHAQYSFLQFWSSPKDLSMESCWKGERKEDTGRKQMRIGKKELQEFSREF
jgi:hypothetical protein